MNKTIDKNKFAIITAIYKGERFNSIPLELVDNSDNLKLVLTLSETGTDTTNMIKFPTSNTKFIIFSKEQLFETLFEVEILDSAPTLTKAKKEVKQVNS